MGCALSIEKYGNSFVSMFSSLIHQGLMKKIVVLFVFLKPSRMYARMQLGVRQLMSVSVFCPVELQQNEEMTHNSRQMIMLCSYKIRQIKQVRILFTVN
jgi:hypothetical protein